MPHSVSAGGSPDSAEESGSNVMLASVGTPAVLTTFVDEVVSKLRGTVSPPHLERSLGAARLAGDVRGDEDAMARLCHHLRFRGFTAAPGSGELVGLLNGVPAEELPRVARDFGNCLGLSQTMLADAGRLCFLSPPIAKLVHASVEQLELALPPGAIVVGPLEGTFRGERGAIGWLHDDEHRTGKHHLWKALFPSSRDFLAGLVGQPSSAQSAAVFDRYIRFISQLKETCPSLVLPTPPAWIGQEEKGLDQLDTLDFTERVIGAIDEYHRSCARCGQLGTEELILDVVNVWIPRARKRLAVLPFEYRAGMAVPFEPGDTRPSAEELDAGGFAHGFESFGDGIAILFYARHVLHQVAAGPELVECAQGSAETRYLVLAPRKIAHLFAGRRESCLSAVSCDSL